MISVDGHTDLVSPEPFVVNGSKSRVRLSTTHLIIEPQASQCVIFGGKKTWEIPLRHLMAVRTRSTMTRKTVAFDVNMKIRFFLLQTRQTVYDRSIKYEAQPVLGDDGRGDSDKFWTPHSKEFFGWQTNHTRGDTIIISYVSKSNNSKEDDVRWSMNTVTLSHTSEDVVAHWSHLLCCALDKASVHRPKNILVFINPFGGKGQALNIFKNTVAPLFREAGLKYRVIVTERANHARDFLRSECLDGIDGVICVGGDGMFSELFNGLLLRSMSEDSSPETIPSPNIRVGLIPGGSTNAMAISLHGTTDVVTAVIHILLGDRLKIDLASVHGDDGEEKLHRFFMAMVSYGYFGDLMVHSERLRWLGPKRYDVSGVHTFLGNRAYKGVIQYVEETNPELTTDPRRIDDVCYANCVHCDALRKSTPSSRESRPVVKVVKGEFKVVTAAVTICACKQSPKGLSPSAHLGDGQMDLILVRKTSRLNYFRYLFRTGYNNKSPFDLPFVSVHRVKEFTFTPSLSHVSAPDETPTDTASDVIIGDPDANGERKSVWNCDGEVLSDPKIRVKVHCQVLPVFARGIERSPATQ